jgi:hypothetical protein
MGMRGALLVSGILFLFLVGCGYAPSSRYWINTVDSSIGKHRNQLITELGPPRSETPLDGGGSRLLFLQVKMFYGSGKYRTSHFQHVEVCRAVFDADKEGIIRTATFYGCS